MLFQLLQSVLVRPQSLLLWAFAAFPCPIHLIRHLISRKKRSNKIHIREVQIPYDASEGGLLKPSECVIWGVGFWPNRHITFIVVKKSLIYRLSFSIYGICGGRGLDWKRYMRGGVGWKVRILSNGGRGLNISQKTTAIWYLNVPLCLIFQCSCYLCRVYT